MSCVRVRAASAQHMSNGPHMHCRRSMWEIGVTNKPLVYFVMKTDTHLSYVCKPTEIQIKSFTGMIVSLLQYLQNIYGRILYVLQYIIQNCKLVKMHMK